MDVRGHLVAARDCGRTTTLEQLESLRGGVQSQLRRSLGMNGKPPPKRCDDLDLAYFPPDSITRRIHADLGPMLIGGLATLLLQMLHPLAMAGVARHSRYREDPLGRLERTAAFVGITTFGTRDDAAAAIARVRAVHERVVGRAADGRWYSANEPDLLQWVHCAEVASFLAAYRIYGAFALSPEEEDAYVREMGRLALDLGCLDPPGSVEALDAYFEAVQPILRFTPEARVARNFVLRGVGKWPHEVATYTLLVAAAQGVLPAWARRGLRLPTLPASDLVAVRPAARTLTTAMRWVITPLPVTAGT